MPVLYGIAFSNLMEPRPFCILHGKVTVRRGFLPHFAPVKNKEMERGKIWTRQKQADMLINPARLRLVSNIVATISAHVEITTALFCNWNVLQTDRYRIVETYLIRAQRN